MADLLAPGLRWLHGTRGSNVYLVESDDGRLALIDTGFGSSSSAILEELSKHEEPLAMVLLTHGHRDHSGAANTVRSATGARLALGRGDCLERNGAAVLHPTLGRTHPLRKLTSRTHRPPHEDTPVDVPLEGELEVLPGIRAVPVPGHTLGAYCFVVERLGAAFVGDLVISHGGELTRSIKWANHDDELYLESIRDFGQVAPELGLPGHGTPVLGGFGESLRELGALPRRSGFRYSFERTRRLLHFSKGITTPRKPTGGRLDDR